MMVKSTKKKRSHIGLIIFTILLVILLGILGVNYKRFTSKQLNPVRDNKVVKKDLRMFHAKTSNIEKRSKEKPKGKTQK